MFGKFTTHVLEVRYITFFYKLAYFKCQLNKLTFHIYQKLNVLEIFIHMIGSFQDNVLHVLSHCFFLEYKNDQESIVRLWKYSCMNPIYFMIYSCITPFLKEKSHTNHDNNITYSISIIVTHQHVTPVSSFAVCGCALS